MTESQEAAATDSGVLPQAAAAEVGPGVLGRVVDRPLDRLVVGQPDHPAAGGQPVVQAAVLAHVGVLQVDELQPGMSQSRPSRVR